MALMDRTTFGDRIERLAKERTIVVTMNGPGGVLEQETVQSEHEARVILTRMVQLAQPGDTFKVEEIE